MKHCEKSNAERSVEICGNRKQGMLILVWEQREFR